MTTPASNPCPLAGPILEEIRRRNLTAGQLARAASLDERGIRRWLKGEKDLAAISLGRIAAAISFRASAEKRAPGRPKSVARPAVAPIPIPDDGTGESAE